MAKAGSPMENEEEKLPLSYISQYGYCPRRAALLMNQQLWQENEYTAEGRAQHQRVHDGRVERRGDQLKLYEFSVWSNELMLSGKCDCVEAVKQPDGASLPEQEGRFRLFPIEYKHGRMRHEPEYEMQLCAQAICLEEMYGVSIPEGALFFIDVHQRLAVSFSEDLRRRTRQTSEALWLCFREKALPPAKESPKCKKCSLREPCMPGLSRSAREYCRGLLDELKEGAP